FLGGFLNRMAARGFIQHVQLDKFGRPPERLKLRQSRLCLGLVSTRDDDGSPGPGQALGHAKSDASIAAGYKSDSVFQVEDCHCEPALCLTGDGFTERGLGRGKACDRHPEWRARHIVELGLMAEGD